MVAMTVVRVHTTRAYSRRPAGTATHTWAARFTAGSLVSGLIWGLGAALLFPSDHEPSQVVLAFVIGGMGAGASSSVASHLPAFYAFLIPAMLPLTIRFAVVGDKFHLGMAFMLGLFAALVGAIGRTTHRTLQESYRLRFSNEQLVGRLKEASASLEERVAERTRRLQDEAQARGEAEHRLQHAQRLDAVGRLTGGVAHDFNNLLTVIVNSLELLDSRPEGKDMRELVRPALDAALRGGELTRSLLAFSRRQDLRPEVVDVRGAVHHLVTRILQRVLPASIEVSVVPGAEELRARVDPTQLEAALLNLSLNARDAMPDGGALRLSVESARVEAEEPDLPAGDYVGVRVVDDGAGIEAGVLDRVFEPFFTTKGDQGTGLGLSMVYGFARQSGGAIKLESEAGHGTAALLLLPRYEGDEQPAEAHHSGTFHVGRGELILVVEDEASVRALTVQSLRSLGYRTIEAQDATVALDLLEENPDVKLVMSDVVMPGSLDGIALARQVRARRPDVRLLIVSGYSEPTGSPIEWPTLAKPYRRDELARAVRDVLCPPRKALISATSSRESELT
jgi:signal transduction histidine kinase/CheY-like chemotaxis protein